MVSERPLCAVPVIRAQGESEGARAGSPTCWVGF